MRMSDIMEQRQKLGDNRGHTQQGPHNEQVATQMPEFHPSPYLDVIRGISFY